MITKLFTKVQKHKGETSIFEVMNDMLIRFFSRTVLRKYLFNCPVIRKNLRGFSFIEKKAKQSGNIMCIFHSQENLYIIVRQ